MDCLQETLVRDRPREVVSALGLRAAEGPVGTDVVPTVVSSREVDTHRVLDFEQRGVAVAIFRGLQAEAVYIRLVMFAVRIMMGHVLIEPKHIYEFMTLLPKDYCVIPGTGVIKLVSLQSCMQGYDPITKGLLTNPRQRRHKTC